VPGSQPVRAPIGDRCGAHRAKFSSLPTNGSVTLWVAGLMVLFPPGGGEEFEGLAASPLNPSLDRDPSGLTRVNTCTNR
jgi:hypothetical protein